MASANVDVNPLLLKQNANMYLLKQRGVNLPPLNAAGEHLPPLKLWQVKMKT